MIPFNWIAKTEYPQYGVYIGDVCIASGFGSRAEAWGWVHRNGQQGVAYKVRLQ